MMRWIYKFPLRLRSLFWKTGVEEELTEELRFHLEKLIAENVAKGMTPDQARYAALRELGGLEQIKEECRDMRRVNYIESFLQDVRYGLRILRKNPGFTAVAMLTLALGIGANTAIFSVVDGLLFRPFPAKNASQLVVIATKEPQSRYLHSVSYPDYLDLQGLRTVFSGAIAYQVMPLNLSGQGQAERIWVEGVTPNYFSLLGIQAARGRTFLPEEGRGGGGPPVLVLSYTFWQRRFGGDPSIIGKPLDLNNHPFTILGVAPESFPGTETLVAVDAYAPVVALDQLPPGSQGGFDQRENRGYHVMARLLPSVNLDRAGAAINVLAHQLDLSYPKTNQGVSFAVIPEKRARPDPADAAFLPQLATIFMALVGLVLVIACANFAGLMLARATSRGREMAIRTAMGASRPRLLRQALVEGTLFGLLGGAAGFLLGTWAVHLLASIKLPSDVPVRLFVPDLDWRVVTFTVVASLLAGAVTGFLPGFRLGGATLNDALKEGSRAGTESSGRNRLRSALVVAQVTVSVLLLLCSGLFVRSLKEAERMDMGFRTDHLLMLSVDVGMQGYDKARGQRFYQDLIDRVKGESWVRSVSLTRVVPFGSENATQDIFTVEHPSTPKEPAFSVFQDVVGFDYFRTMGTPLERGRDFSAQDNESSPKVAIISQTMARLLWPGKDALGRRIQLGRDGSWAEVIGVARDIKFTLPYSEARPLVYLPLAQEYQSETTLLVHTTGNAEAFLNSAREQIRALDPSLAAYDVKTMATHIRAGVALLPVRLGAALVGAFGLMGLVLAVVGLYGVVSYVVSRRTHEIGIRMALGARRVDILKLVVGRGAILTLAGVALGVVAGLGVTRLITGLLYEVSATDPTTFVVVPLVLIAVALVATYIPARQAMKVDPMVALRYE